MADEASNRRVRLAFWLALLGGAIGGGVAYLAEASKREVGVACAEAVGQGCTPTVSEVPVSVAVVVIGAVLGACTVTAVGLLVRALIVASK
jgi:hypothetical protein